MRTQVNRITGIILNEAGVPACDSIQEQGEEKGEQDQP